MLLVDRTFYVVFDLEYCNFVTLNGDQDDINKAEKFKNIQGAVEWISTFDEPSRYEIWEFKESLKLKKRMFYKDLVNNL